MFSSHGESEDVDFEPEDELGTVGAAKAKMQKLRDELTETKKERQEYLDGWQRAKADLINARKDSADAIQRAATLGRDAFVEELIPALDSFDMAMRSDAWKTVDPAWRVGVESIYAQLQGVLQAHGVEIFGKEGEKFDPTLHEAIEEREGGESHTIAKVMRPGYRTKSRILRPAQVAIFK